MGAIKRLLKEESGQGLAEYGLILALIAIVVVFALKSLGNTISNKLNEVGNEIEGAGE